VTFGNFQARQAAMKWHKQACNRDAHRVHMFDQGMWKHVGGRPNTYRLGLSLVLTALFYNGVGALRHTGVAERLQETQTRR
jgi:hypothetical protein